MKKVLVCLAALLGLAVAPAAAEAACPVLRVRAPRVVAAVRIVNNHHANVAAVVNVQRIVVAQHFIAEPVRAFAVVADVHGYGYGYNGGGSASLLAEELRLERLRRESLSAGDIDAKLAKFKAELKLEIKEDVIAAVKLALQK